MNRDINNWKVWKGVENKSIKMMGSATPNSVKMQHSLRRYNSLIVFPCSMKQIPFMVPQHSCTTPPAVRHTRSEDENYSSEPSSPSSKRPSVEIPGKCFCKFIKIPCIFVNVIFYQNSVHASFLLFVQLTNRWKCPVRYFSLIQFIYLGGRST